MKITLFSFFMACLWSNSFIIVIFCLRRHAVIIRFFTVSGLFLLYLFCLIRMVLPFELPLSQIIVLKPYSAIYLFLNRTVADFYGMHITAGGLLILIWITGIAVSLSKMIDQYYDLYHYYIGFASEAGPEMKTILKQVAGDDKGRYHLLQNTSLDSPVSCGIFKKYILFPVHDYDNHLAFCMMKHEFCHLANHDYIVKLLLVLLHCFYWWNPVIHMLSRDLEQILEIKCDLTATADMDEDEKADYLEAFRKTIRINRKNQNPETGAMHLLRRNLSQVMERSEYVERSVLSKQRKVSVFIVVLLVLSFTMSYSFIIQSDFTVPIEDVVLHDIDYALDANDHYIIKNQDGTYILVISDQSSVIITNEQAVRMQEDGYQVKETLNR